MLKNCPCKVKEISTSKAGKHGSAKCLITGKDIFTGKKMGHSFNSQENIEAPKVQKEEFHLIDIINEDQLILENPHTGECSDDQYLPTATHLVEVADRIMKSQDNDRTTIVTVMTWGDQSIVCATREQK